MARGEAAFFLDARDRYGGQVRRRNVRVRQWNRYVERLPASSVTPPGYLRLTHPAALTVPVMPDGTAVQPHIDAAKREAQRTGDRPRPFAVKFIAYKQGRRR